MEFDKQSAELIARAVRKVLQEREPGYQSAASNSPGIPAAFFKLTSTPTIDLENEETEYKATGKFVRWSGDWTTGGYEIQDYLEQTIYFPFSSIDTDWVVASPQFQVDSVIAAIFRGRWECISSQSSVRVGQITSPMSDGCNTGTAHLCYLDPEATPAGPDDLCSQWVATTTELTIYDPLSRCWAAGSRVILAPALSTNITSTSETNTAYWVIIEGIRKALVVSGTVDSDTTASTTCDITVDSLYWGYDPCGASPLEINFEEAKTLVTGQRIWAFYRPCSDSYWGLEPPNPTTARYGKVGTGWTNYDGGDTPLHTITLTACDYAGVLVDPEETFVATIPYQPNKDTALFQDYIVKCVLTDGNWVIDTYCWDDPVGTIKAVDLDSAIRDGWEELTDGQNRVLIGHGDETTDMGTQDGEDSWTTVIDPSTHGPIMDHTISTTTADVLLYVDTGSHTDVLTGVTVSQHEITDEDEAGVISHSQPIPMPPCYVVKWIRRFE